ncbi:stage V sporulation protein D [Haloplasma contractile]|uniref:Stage V sporulation protein D n=1 Tax=Haloplasma contractile SSD-17B TaxID=1033810 RepID=F7Q1D1_9MOLU|nr:stage V sporulation protein D [Haloplasma contractile]ERJ12850.1 Stage V sporulation protein D [Haloplasma contractile SSD-17B]
MNDNILVMQKRLTYLIIMIVIAMILLISRLGYVQFVNGGDITDKAYDLWSRNIPVEGQRGYIYDRNGKVIVGNTLAPSVAVIPRQVKDKEAVAQFLSDVLEMDYKDAFEHVTKNVSVELIKPEGRKVSVEQASKIIKANHKGVYLVGDTVRDYPYDHYLAHVLGFVGIDNQGITGIEYIYDDYLMGEGGNSKYYTDAKGHLLDGMYGFYEAPTKGMDIYLTIDIDVQILLERVIENAIARYNPDGMLGLVMDPRTSEVIAMASYPTFDPSSYQEYDQEIYNRNLPIWKSYEPGSTFKIITYSAGLEEGVFELDDHFYDPGYKIVEGIRIKDWKAGGHGDQTFLEVIQNSCNPGFMEIGERLGKESLFKYIDAYGFGQKTGVDLLGESTGIVFNVENVGPVELATSSFGQGNSVTPIQLVNAASAAVNGGVLHQPYVLKEIRMPVTNELIYENQPTEVRRVISEETSKKMQYALESVTALGTGRNSYIEGYRVGGKTGTAQKAVDGRYLEGNYILSFIGIAPMNNPQLAVYIAIDNPKNTIQYGGVVAAPLVREVLQEALPIMGIPKQDNQIEKEYRWGDIRYFEVPNFIGQKKSSFNLYSPYYSVEFYGDGNTITFQSPQPGDRVPEGSSIMLYLGKKEE